ncbi:hypothetical protein [Streptomyces sp. cg35]|uniref:hypothetical protein n=1 Tax=Streptomyces sp. cg35 TaxID=3421650 RepID=UPI003D18740F
MTDTTIDPTAIHFETQDCGRCGGTGEYSFNQLDGTRCYGCGGSGQRYSARGRRALKAYEAALGASEGTVHVRDLKPGMRIKSKAHGGVTNNGTVYNLKSAWRTITDVEIVEETLTNRGSDGKASCDVEGVRARIKFEGERTWSAETSDDERYWHKNAVHMVGTTRGFWLAGDEARTARTAVRIAIAARFTGAWLGGEEEPAPAARKQPAPKAPAAPAPLKANIYPGNCHLCGGHVAAKEGQRLKLNGRWAVQHADAQCPASKPADTAPSAPQQPQETPVSPTEPHAPAPAPQAAQEAHGTLTADGFTIEWTGKEIKGHFHGTLTLPTGKRVKVTHVPTGTLYTYLGRDGLGADARTVFRANTLDGLAALYADEETKTRLDAEAATPEQPAPVTAIERPAIHARDISRKIGKALDAQGFKRDAATGWTVRAGDTPSSVDITLNCFDSDRDEEALTLITQALGDGYDIDFVPVLADYDHLPKALYMCAVAIVRKKPAQDTVQVRVPAALSRAWTASHQDAHTSLDAAERDMHAAWYNAPQDKHGAVALTLSRPLARHFADMIEMWADNEGYADDADLKAIADAPKLLARLADLGIRSADLQPYTMASPAAQTALEADQLQAYTEREEARAASEDKAAQTARSQQAHAELADTLLGLIGPELAGRCRPATTFTDRIELRFTDWNTDRADADAAAQILTAAGYAIERPRDRTRLALRDAAL